MSEAHGTNTSSPQLHTLGPTLALFSRPPGHKLRARRSQHEAMTPLPHLFENKLSHKLFFIMVGSTGPGGKPIAC